MKNFVKLFGFFALAAVIGFSMAACDNGSTDGDSPNAATYKGTRYSTNYTLKITKAATKSVLYADSARAITPEAGDSYELTVGAKKSTGTVQAVDGSTFTLKPNTAGAGEFNTTVSGNGLTDVIGLITFDDNTSADGHGALSGGGSNIGRIIDDQGTGDKESRRYRVELYSVSSATIDYHKDTWTKKYYHETVSADVISRSQTKLIKSATDQPWSDVTSILGSASADIGFSSGDIAGSIKFLEDHLLVPNARGYAFWFSQGTTCRYFYVNQD